MLKFFKKAPKGSSSSSDAFASSKRKNDEKEERIKMAVEQSQGSTNVSSSPSSSSPNENKVSNGNPASSTSTSTSSSTGPSPPKKLKTSPSKSPKTSPAPSKQASSSSGSSDSSIKNTDDNNNNNCVDMTLDEDSDEDLLPSKPVKNKNKKIVVDDDDDEKKKKAKANEVTKSSSPSPKKATPSKKKSTPKKSPKAPKAAPPAPSAPCPARFDCGSTPLTGYTFVFTGVLSTLSRDEAVDYVKEHGGRVTTGVSGKTSYLVMGGELEDGRPTEEGSKYKKSLEQPEKTTLLKDEADLFGLVKMLHGGDSPSPAPAPAPAPAAASSTSSTSSSATSVSNPYAKKAPSNPYAAKNPYAKAATPGNPYASKSNKPSNPYASGGASNPYAKSSSSTASSSSSSASSGPPKGGGRADVSDRNALWADKYAPSSTGHILGNGTNVRKLTDFINGWERKFNVGGKPGRGEHRAALLSGPPGIGKTTTAVLVSELCGRHVLELNASDARGKKALESALGDVLGSQVLSFGPHKKKKRRVLIMDEVDGMGAGDRAGMAELIKIIKTSKIPIICICNDRQSPKVRSLANYCLDLKFSRPTKSIIARRAVEIGHHENMDIEPNAAEALAESCGNDIRQVLNALQMWATKAKGSASNPGERISMKYKEFKDRSSEIGKDEMLRVSMFDAGRMIMEGRRNLKDATDEAKKVNFLKRNDAFFTDYGMMGLLVHQNYPKVISNDYKRAASVKEKQDLANRLADATEAMSDFGVLENMVRGGDQHWELLTSAAALCVQTGSIAGGPNGGFLPGFPEFPGWLGKNSSKGKHDRLLSEMQHHMNVCVGVSNTEIRSSYIPAFRAKIMKLMKDPSGPRVGECIELMDEYGLSREDVFETMDEFCMTKNENEKFSSIDSKVRAAFTRAYNAGTHKSQALVAEQGVDAKKRKKVKKVKEESAELGVVNDDGEDDDDDEEEEEDLGAQAFMKKRKAAGKKKESSAAAKKKKTKKT